MRVNFAIACLALALFLWLPGCAALSGLVNPPGRLLEQARSAIEREDLEAAYSDLVEIRKRYPDSAESREAFDAILASPEGKAAVADVPNYASGGVTFIYTEIQEIPTQG